MAASFVRQSTGGTSGTATTGTVNLSAAPATGNVLVACVALGSTTAGASLTSVSSTGATWTRVAQSQQNATGTNRQEIWVGTSVTGTTVSVALSAASKWCANISEWSGLSGLPAYTALHAEGFDGVPAGTFPADWTADSLLTTGDGGTELPSSTPNAVIYPVSGSSSTPAQGAYWTTQDTAGGQVRVSATFCHLGTGAGAGEQDCNLLARCTQAILNANFGTFSAYFLSLQRNGGSPGLLLQKRISGTTSVLASTGSAAFADAVRYRLSVLCVGSSLSAQCQRLSDGFWLNGSGTFVSDPTGQTVALTVQDTDVPGAGYAGLMFYLANTSGSDIGADDFLLEQAAASGTGSLGATTTTTSVGPLQAAGYGDLIIGAMNLATSRNSTDFTGTSGSPEAATALTYRASGLASAQNVGMQAVYDIASGALNESLSWTTAAAWQYAHAAVVLKAADPVPLGYGFERGAVNAAYRM